MSMIQELLKTPLEVRQEQEAKLLAQGQRSAATLLNPVQASTAAPGIFGNWAASIAQQQPLQADRLKRGLMQAAGGVAGAAGAPDVKRTLIDQSYSPEERQAVETQSIMKGLKDSKDKEAGYRQAAKKAYDAGNSKLGFALEQKAEELGKVKFAQERALTAESQADQRIKQTTEQIDIQREGVRLQERGVAMQELKSQQDSTLFKQSQNIQEVMAGVQVTEDPVAYHLSLAKALASNGYGAAAQEMSKQAAELRKDPTATPDRWIKAGDNLFDTTTETFVTPPKDAEGNPSFENPKEYEYYIETMNDTNSALTDSRKAGDLIRILDMPGVDFSEGVPASISSYLKDNFGVRDVDSALKTWLAGIKTTEAFKALPPGPATEREVQGAFETVPPKNAGVAEQLAWLKRAERASMIVAEYGKSRAGFIEQNKGLIGLGTNSESLYKQSVLNVDARLKTISEAPSAGDLELELNTLLGGG